MLKFEQENEKKYIVTINDIEAGELVFDDEQNAWVFDWGEDGTTYEESLADTIEELKDDFVSGEKDNMVTAFGKYEY